MRRLIRLHALGAFGLALAAASLLEAAASPHSLILGRVVADRTGAPVAGAKVQIELPPIAAVNPRAPSPPVSVATVIATDDSGRFVLSDLPGGTFAVTASSAGFQPASQRLSLSEGERRGDVTIRLVPTGSISGTVMDEYGDPFPGLAVTVRRALQPGPIGREREVRTDDRGRYRFDGLLSGTYTIVVGLDSAFVTSPGSAMAQLLSDIGTLGGVQSAPPLGGRTVSVSGSVRLGGSEIQPVGTLARNAPPPRSDGSMWVYPITYLGDTHAAGSANAITIGPGDERFGADLHLTLIRTARLSGTLRDRNGPVSQQQLFLGAADVNDGAMMDAIAAARTDPQGRFAIMGVPPGRYVLSVLQPAVAMTPEPPPPNVSELTLRAMAIPRRPSPAKFSIDVEGLDLDGLDLSIPPGDTTTAIHVATPLAPPKAIAKPRTAATNVLRGVVVDSAPDRRPVRRAVVSFGDAARGSTRIDITDGDGRFAFDNVINLDVPISAAKLGYTTAQYPSARARDITLTLQPASSVSGWVHESDGRPASGVQLKLHPVGEAVSSVNFVLGSYGTLSATTDDQGAFRVWGLPARTYTLSAIIEPSVPMRATTSADVSWALGQLRAGAMPSPRPTAVGLAPAANGRAATTVYYPNGTTSAADAARIVVHAGEALEGIELRLPRVAGG